MTAVSIGDAWDIQRVGDLYRIAFFTTGITEPTGVVVLTARNAGLFSGELHQRGLSDWDAITRPGAEVLPFPTRSARRRKRK